MMAWLTPRMVAGIDAADSAAIPAVMPGMMRKGMPASASAMASSPPRPNMQGSPPLSRSTRLFWRASSINRLEISACCADGRPPRLPANSSSAWGLASASTRASTSASCTMTLAWARPATASSVSRPGIAGAGAGEPDVARLQDRKAAEQCRECFGFIHIPMTYS